jgi:hypothetical protein
MMDVAFGGKKRPLEGRYLSLTFPMFDLERSKHLYLGIDVIFWV